MTRISSRNAASQSLGKPNDDIMKTKLFAFALTCSLLLSGCADSRNVSLTAKRTDSALEFDLTPHGGLSIGNVEVWDVETKELLWKVYVSRMERTSLTYGVVPAQLPGQGEPKQLLPEAGQPPRAPAPGHRLFVLVAGHYSNSLNPGAGTLLYAHLVTIGDDGSVVSVEQRPRVMYSDVKMLPPAKGSP
jgi:hypothetical protein